MRFKKEIQKRPLIRLNYLLSMPFIYPLIIPLVLADIMGEIYHRICFPLYGMPYVKRRDYIKIDRYRLKYLGWLARFNCAYCGYVSGLLHYFSAIAVETEDYWCSILHAKRKGFKVPKHHKNFLPYGDEESFKKFLEK